MCFIPSTPYTVEVEDDKGNLVKVSEHGEGVEVGWCGLSAPASETRDKLWGPFPIAGPLISASAPPPTPIPTPPPVPRPPAPPKDLFLYLPYRLNAEHPGFNPQPRTVVANDGDGAQITTTSLTDPTAILRNWAFSVGTAGLDWAGAVELDVEEGKRAAIAQPVIHDFAAGELYILWCCTTGGLMLLVDAMCQQTWPNSPRPHLWLAAATANRTLTLIDLDLVADNETGHVYLVGLIDIVRNTEETADPATQGT